VIAAFLVLSACASNKTPEGSVVSGPLSGVPSVRLNYRYEGDVPAPETVAGATEEKHPTVLSDFHQNRPQEQLDRTVTSPDSKRVLAIYHRGTDV